MNHSQNNGFWIWLFMWIRKYKTVGFESKLMNIITMIIKETLATNEANWTHLRGFHIRSGGHGNFFD